MKQFLETRRYGVIIAAVLVLTGLWLPFDSQAHSTHPGWLSGLHRHVWCQTTVTDRETGSQAAFGHYPGKRLKRVLRDLHVPRTYAGRYLRSKKKTKCYKTWREAALAHPVVAQATAAYGAVLAHWSESDYQAALLLVQFDPQGLEQLQALLSQQAQAGHSPTEQGAAP